MNNKQKYHDQMLLKFDENEARLSILEKALEGASPTKKRSLCDRMSEIRDNQRIVSQKLIEMNTTPDSHWTSLKISLEKLYGEISDRITFIESRLKD